MDCSPPGSSVHGILQARILEWAAISFSRGSSRLRNWTRVSWVQLQADDLPTELWGKPFWILKLNTYKKNADCNPTEIPFLTDQFGTNRKVWQELHEAVRNGFTSLTDGMQMSSRSMYGTLKWQTYTPGKATSRNYSPDNSHMQNGIKLRLIFATFFVMVKSWKQP